MFKKNLKTMFGAYDLYSSKFKLFILGTNLLSTNSKSKFGSVNKMLLIAVNSFESFLHFSHAFISCQVLVQTLEQTMK